MKSLYIGIILASSAMAMNAQETALADSILKYQMVSGGWPKNQKWLEGADQKYMAECKRTGVGSTIDNGATTFEMNVLAKVYRETGDERYRSAFIQGLKYLLEMQYDNGGWPQFYPVRKVARYSAHITFNDNAMVNVMRMLQDIAEEKGDYAGLKLDRSLRKAAMKAHRRGIECILKCQIRKDGKLTVWCQQHDEHTLLPASARAYELASYTGHGETVAIIQLLMDIERPSKAVKRAIEGAVEWLEQHAIRDRVVEHFTNEDGLPDIRLVYKKSAPLLWARYYDLDNAEPFFCDRDGKPKKDISEIGYERRNGYSWLGTTPERIISRLRK